MTQTATTWQRDAAEHPQRPLGQAMRRGALLKCPSCGTGSMYRAYLKVADACPSCGEQLHHHRADDAPPYFTIVLVGHIVVPLVLTVEKLYAPPIWFQATFWSLVTLLLALVFLPLVKGALVGLQWALYMHGFDPKSSDREDWDGTGIQPTGPQT